MPKYDNVEMFKNNNDLYHSFLKERNVKFINQYSTANLVYPTQKQMDNLNIARHLWRNEDAYWKLSQQYYNTPNYWWVIGFINKTPLDSQLSVGDIIEIPLDIYQILNIIEG